MKNKTNAQILDIAMQYGLIGNEWYEIREGQFEHRKRLTDRARSICDYTRSIFSA